MSDSTRTFTQALLRLGAFVNHQKFYLTVEFIDEAKNSKYASISETLHLLAESFWSSHITSHHYQFDAITPVGISTGLKIVSMYALGTLFPMFMPFLLLFILLQLKEIVRVKVHKSESSFLVDFQEVFQRGTALKRWIVFFAVGMFIQRMTMIQPL